MVRRKDAVEKRMMGCLFLSLLTGLQSTSDALITGGGGPTQRQSRQRPLDANFFLITAFRANFFLITGSNESLDQKNFHFSWRFFRSLGRAFLIGALAHFSQTRRPDKQQPTCPIGRRKDSCIAVSHQIHACTNTHNLQRIPVSTPR